MTPASPQLKVNNQINNNNLSIMNTYELLKKYQVKKGDTIKLPTNTRIGDDKSGIYGGSYHIPDDEYNQFLSVYYRDTVAKNKNEYFV